MMNFMHRKKLCFFNRLAASLVLVNFLATTLLPAAYAQEIFLPAPGSMVHLSPSFNPPMLKGIKVYPDNPFQFDFILDNGKNAPSSDTEEASKLVKYFLASLTTPENDMWVNLSPYEKDRIVPQSFGQTEMGRDLLAQDYMLKQITASLIYPEDELGKKFWDRVYAEAKKKFGTTDIPVNTFNKVWIVPAKAVVYENPQSASAYVVDSKLKVMLEEDYVALANQKARAESFAPAKDVAQTATNAIGNQIVREIVIPALTKEVNEGKNFAQLRQIYNSLILAAWYKKKIKDSILSQVYVDRNKVAGIDIDDPNEKQIIYEQYLEAFKKGAYNYIKEEIDPVTSDMIPKKYFSGGFSATAMDMKNVLSITASSGILDAVEPIKEGEILQIKLASSVASSGVNISPEDQIRINEGHGQYLAKSRVKIQRIPEIKSFLEAIEKFNDPKLRPKFYRFFASDDDVLAQMASPSLNGLGYEFMLLRLKGKQEWVVLKVEERGRKAPLPKYITRMIRKLSDISIHNHPQETGQALPSTQDLNAFWFGLQDSDRRDFIRSDIGIVEVDISGGLRGLDTDEWKGKLYKVVLDSPDLADKATSDPMIKGRYQQVLDNLFIDPGYLKLIFTPFPQINRGYWAPSKAKLSDQLTSPYEFDRARAIRIIDDINSLMQDPDFQRIYANAISQDPSERLQRIFIEQYVQIVRLAALPGWKGHISDREVKQAQSIIDIFQSKRPDLIESLRQELGLVSSPTTPSASSAVAAKETDQERTELLAAAEDRFEKPFSQLVQKPERELNEKVAERNSAVEIQMELDRLLTELGAIVSQQEIPGLFEIGLDEREASFLKNLRSLYQSMPVAVHDELPFAEVSQLLKDLRASRNKIYAAIEKADREKDSEALKDLNRQAIRNNRLLLKAQILTAGKMMAGKSNLRGRDMILAAVSASLHGAMNTAQHLKRELGYRIGRLQAAGMVREIETTDWLGKIIRTYRMSGFDIEVSPKVEGQEPTVTIRQQYWVNAHTRLDQVLTDLRAGRVGAAQIQLENLRNLYNVKHLIIYEKYREIADVIGQLRARTNDLLEGNKLLPGQIEGFASEVNRLKQMIDNPKQRVWVDVEIEDIDAAFRSYIYRFAGYVEEIGTMSYYKTTLEFFASLLKDADQAKFLSKRNLAVLSEGLAPIVEWAQRGMVYQKQRVVINLAPAVEKINAGDYSGAQEDISRAAVQLQERLREIESIVASSKKQAVSVFSAYRDKDITRRADGISRSIREKDFESAFRDLEVLIELYFNQDLVEPGYFRAEASLHKLVGLVRAAQRVKDPSSIMAQAESLLKLVQNDVAHKYSLKVYVVENNGKRTFAYVNPGTTVAGFLKIRGIDPQKVRVSLGAKWLKPADLNRTRISEKGTVVINTIRASSGIAPGMQEPSTASSAVRQFSTTYMNLDEGDKLQKLLAGTFGITIARNQPAQELLKLIPELAALRKTLDKDNYFDAIAYRNSAVYAEAAKNIIGKYGIKATVVVRQDSRRQTSKKKPFEHTYFEVEVSGWKFVLDITPEQFGLEKAGIILLPQMVIKNAPSRYWMYSTGEVVRTAPVNAVQDRPDFRQDGPPKAGGTFNNMVRFYQNESKWKRVLQEKGIVFPENGEGMHIVLVGPGEQAFELTYLRQIFPRAKQIDIVDKLEPNEIYRSYLESRGIRYFEQSIAQPVEDVKDADLVLAFNVFDMAWFSPEGLKRSSDNISAMLKPGGIFVTNVNSDSRGPIDFNSGQQEYRREWLKGDFGEAAFLPTDSLKEGYLFLTNKAQGQAASSALVPAPSSYTDKFNDLVQQIPAADRFNVRKITTEKIGQLERIVVTLSKGFSRRTVEVLVSADEIRGLSYDDLGLNFFEKSGRSEQLMAVMFTWLMDSGLFPQMRNVRIQETNQGARRFFDKLVRKWKKDGVDEGGLMAVEEAIDPIWKAVNIDPAKLDKAKIRASIAGPRQASSSAISEARRENIEMLAAAVFDRIKRASRLSEGDFWHFLLFDLKTSILEENYQLIRRNEFEKAGANWEAEVRYFAQQLDKLWQTKAADQKASFQDKYGSIFAIMTLSISSDDSGDTRQLRLQHTWLYEFLAAADPVDQAKSLWAILVSNVIHMREIGEHREGDENGERISHDVEILFGREGYRGAIAHFIDVFKVLDARPELAGQVVSVWDPVSSQMKQVKLRDAMLGALAMTMDATIHYPRHYLQYAQNFPETLAEIQADQEALPLMLANLDRSLLGLELSNSDARKYIVEAMQVTDAQWKEKGLVGPVEATMGQGNLRSLYFYDMSSDQFSAKLFSPVLDGTLLKWNFMNTGDIQAVIKLRQELNRWAWSQMDRFPEIAAKFKTETVASSAILNAAPLSVEAKRRIGDKVFDFIGIFNMARNKSLDSELPGYQAIFYKDTETEDPRNPTLPQRFRRIFREITDKDERKIFAAALNDEWKSRGFERDFGSVFEYVAHLMSDYRASPSQIKAGYEWFYDFLDAAPLLERTLALRLLVLGFNNHMRSGGLHVENEAQTLSLARDSFPLDAELFLGNDRDLLGPQIFQRFILSLLELQQTPQWTEVIPGQSDKPNNIGLTYEDMFLWALMLAVDPSVYGEGYANYPTNQLKAYLSRYFNELVEVKRAGVKFLEKGLNHPSISSPEQRAQIQALFQKAFNITEQQWVEKGQRSPFSFVLNYDYLSYILSAATYWTNKPSYLVKDPMLMLGFDLRYLPEKIRPEFTMPSIEMGRHKILWEQGGKSLRALYAEMYKEKELADILPGLVIPASSSAVTDAQWDEIRQRIKNNLPRFTQAIAKSYLVFDKALISISENEKQDVHTLIPDGATILVAGFGQNWEELTFLAEQFPRAKILGVDWLKENVDTAKIYTSEFSNIEIQEADVRKLNLEGRKVGMVFSSWLLDGLLFSDDDSVGAQAVAEILDSLYKQLSDGGYFVASPANRFVKSFLAEKASATFSDKGSNDIAFIVGKKTTASAAVGGIDFNADKLNLETQTSGGDLPAGQAGIKFQMDPQQLQELQGVPGFMPVIINIQPMINLRMFLGLKEGAETPLAISKVQ